ncbi:MAG: hypothetical protein WCB51_11780, partial [Candidatus Dormiibacterota bacterium]
RIARIVCQLSDRREACETRRRQRYPFANQERGAPAVRINADKSRSAARAVPTLRRGMLLVSLMTIAGCGAATSAPAVSATPRALPTATPTTSPTGGSPVSVACALLSKEAAAALTGDPAMTDTTNTRVKCTYSHNANFATLQLQPLTGTTVTALQNAVDSDNCSTATAPITVLPDGAFEIIDAGCDALAFASGNLICNIEAATRVPAATANLEVGVETLADQAHSGLAGA